MNDDTIKRCVDINLHKIGLPKPACIVGSNRLVYL